MKGQPDNVIINNHKEYNSLCIEFKSPTNNYKISEAQLEMKKRINKMDIGFSFPMIMTRLSPI